MNVPDIMTDDEFHAAFIRHIALYTLCFVHKDFTSCLDELAINPRVSTEQWDTALSACFDLDELLPGLWETMQQRIAKANLEDEAGVAK